MKRALIIVDMQNDFVHPQGALHVPGAEELIPKILELSLSQECSIIVTLDYHPENHYSFTENGGGWPKHCVQGTWGAKLVDELDKLDGRVEIYKGTDPNDRNDYSGFSGSSRGISLRELLERSDIGEVDIVGLALDYCVKATALDAIRLGFKARVLLRYTKAVNAHPDDGEKAIEEMKKAGVEIIE